MKEGSRNKREGNLARPEHKACGGRKIRLSGKHWKEERGEEEKEKESGRREDFVV